MKKIILMLGLLIPSFSFAINTPVNIGQYQDLGGNLCTINNDLSFDCENSNNVLVGTNNGDWQPSSSSYFRTDDGLGFYYRGNNLTTQGYVSSFQFCGSSGNPSVSCNRSSVSYSGFIDYFNSNELTAWAWYGGQSNIGTAGPVFIFGDSYFLFAPDYNYDYQFYGTFTPYDFGLHGWGLEADYSNIGVINSPFAENNTTTPTEQYTCPTVQQLINTYQEQYNTGLCYSSNIIYSGGTIQTITPKTIFELYPTRIDLNQDIQNYNTYCNNVTTQQACQTIFEGKNEEYTLIAKIPQDVMPIQLYAYCNLTLNMDPNQTTCTASTGTINNGIGIDDIIDNIGKSPITVITPGTPPEDEGNGTGSVFDKYTQQGDDTNRRNIIQKAEDTIQTMKEIYTKLTSIFRARQGKNGVIPPLITGLIALIVLYKLFKK